MKKCTLLFMVIIEIWALKYHTFSKKKALVFSFICSKCENEDDKYLKKN